MRTMRRALILLLLFSMLLPTAAQAAGGNYTDVPKKHWAYASIYSASRCDILQGVGGGKFDPAGKMTRAAYVTALCRLMGWKTVTPAKGSFDDNQNPKAWYYAAIETAYANEVLTDESALCRPGETITRAEAAVMTVRALGYAALSGLVQDECPFSDVSAGRGYVMLAYRMGLVTGRNFITFDPQGALKREQAAVILMRAYAAKSTRAKTSYDAAPASAVRVAGIVGTSGSVPLSPRAPQEQVYDAAVEARGGAVVLHVTPYRQTIHNGKISAGEEISKDEVVALIADGAQVCRSARYESSYLLYKDGSKTCVVWYESDADIAQKVKLCGLLGAETVYLEK